jgi:hypothetical protein
LNSLEAGDGGALEFKDSSLPPIVPQAGQAVLFDMQSHPMHRGGELWTNKTKVILRTDIIGKRVKPSLPWHEYLFYLREAADAADGHDQALSDDLWVKVMDIESQHRASE